MYQINLIVSFSFGWLNQSVIRFYSKDPKDINTALIFMLCLAIIIALMVNLFFDYEYLTKKNINKQIN